MAHDAKGEPIEPGAWTQLHMAAWRGDLDFVSQTALMALACASASPL